MRLIYHPDAEMELISASQYYERKVASLGRRFLDDFESACAVIERDPTQWAVVDADVRRYLLPKFPYSIYYRLADGHIRVLAVMHQCRHPDYWRYRLTTS